MLINQSESSKPSLLMSKLTWLKTSYPRESSSRLFEGQWWKIARSRLLLHSFEPWPRLSKWVGRSCWEKRTWRPGTSHSSIQILKFRLDIKSGLNRDLNPGPLAPKARIIPLDHWALIFLLFSLYMNKTTVTVSRSTESSTKWLKKLHCFRNLDNPIQSEISYGTTWK